MRRFFMTRACLLALAVASISGCRTYIDMHPGGGKLMERGELFFGMSIPGGGQVSESDWQKFVDEQITPAFPDGFTIIDGHGQWRDASGQIDHEPSKILVVFDDPGLPTRARLEQIRSAYKQRFHQESVIFETSQAWVSF
jgi:hypothetical protein